MKTVGIRSPLVILIALALVLSGAGLADAQSKGTIKIATQSPLSGGQAEVGEGLKLGTQLAIEQKKGALEKLGFKVELVPFDDQAKPDVGVANAKNIIADKDIMLVIGHWNSGVAIPSSEVYKDVQLAMISPANTNPIVTDRNLLNVSRVCGRDDVQGEVGAKFAKEVLKVKTAYIVHDKTTYGQGVAEFFRAWSQNLGINVLGFEGTEEKSNFDSIITPIKAKNPDVVYFGGIYDQGAPFYKQVREKGVKAIFLGPDGMDAADFVRIAGKTVVNAYYTTAGGPIVMYPKAKDFAKTYKEKFKKDPTPYAAEAYDATSVGLKAIEKAITDGGGKMPAREAVSVNIRKTKLEGITGHIEFDEKGDPNKATYYVLQVASDDPEKWSENKEAKRLAIAAPPLKK